MQGFRIVRKQMYQIWEKKKLDREKALKSLLIAFFPQHPLHWQKGHFGNESNERSELLVTCQYTAPFFSVTACDSSLDLLFLKYSVLLFKRCATQAKSTWTTEEKLKSSPWLQWSLTNWSFNLYPDPLFLVAVSLSAYNLLNMLSSRLPSDCKQSIIVRLRFFFLQCRSLIDE